MQVKGLLFVAQVLIESRNDLNERTHDVRKEGNTCQHNENAEDHLDVGLRRQVSITNCWQCRDREIAGRDHPVGSRCVLQLESINEILLVIFVSEKARPQVEEAADEVGDNDSQQNQSEHTVDVLHDQWENHFFASSLVGKQCFHKLIDPVHLQQCENALDSD